MFFLSFFFSFGGLLRGYLNTHNDTRLHVREIGSRSCGLSSVKTGYLRKIQELRVCCRRIHLHTPSRCRQKEEQTKEEKSEHGDKASQKHASQKSVSLYECSETKPILLLKLGTPWTVKNVSPGSPYRTNNPPEIQNLFFPTTAHIRDQHLPVGGRGSVRNTKSLACLEALSRWNHWNTRRSGLARRHNGRGRAGLAVCLFHGVSVQK